MHARIRETGDFWLFDADTDRPYAVAMDYDAEGHWLGATLVEDRARIAGYRNLRDLLWPGAVALNAFLTTVSDTDYARSA